MEILHNNTHKHVEHKEAHQKNERNKVQESPFGIILYWLKISKLSNSVL